MFGIVQAWWPLPHKTQNLQFIVELLFENHACLTTDASGPCHIRGWAAHVARKELPRPVLVRTMPKCLKSTPQVKETKGFVLQIQQGANREKTHMQVAEQDMSMWLGVPRIAIYVLACNDLEYFQRTPDHFDSPYWTHVFEVAMEKA